MSVNSEEKLNTDRFGKLALAHIDSIYRLALYMAGDEDDAQSLVRNTYLEAYRSFSRFEAETICKAWLLGILNDTFMNVGCHSSREQQIGFPSAGKCCGTRLPNNTNDEVSRDRFDDDIINAINELPVQYRVIVMLADVEELSYKKITNIVGRPIQTVMSRLCIGRRLIGKRLQDRQFSSVRGYEKLIMAITGEGV